MTTGTIIGGVAALTPQEAAAEALGRFEAAVREQEAAAADTTGILSGAWQWATGTTGLGESIQARATSARQLYDATLQLYWAADTDAKFMEVVSIAGRHANVADLADAVRLTQPGAVFTQAIADAPATIGRGAAATVTGIATGLGPGYVLAIAAAIFAVVYFTLRKGRA